MCLALIVTGCASYTDQTREIRSSYIGESYDAALKKLETSELKDQNRNRLLYKLEKAMILDRKQDRKASRTLFVEADKVVDELYTESITKAAASFIYNDSTTEYAGEDFEKVAIHSELALSFLEDRDTSAATVEARRINSRLNEINQKYDEKSRNRYGEDAFARYLAAMIYESRDEIDNAIIDYTSALKTYEGIYTEHFNTPPPDDLIVSLYRLLDKRKRKDQMEKLEKKYMRLVAKARKLDPNEGELIVIHEAGTIAIKQAENFVLPIAGQVVRFSFPVIRQRGSGFWGTTGVDIPGVGLVRGDLSQNMDAIASKSLEDRRFRLIIKEGARLLVKGQITRKATEQFGILGWVAGNVYGAVTETADTRSWTLLPAAYYVTRARLNPGPYAVTVKTNGRISKIQNVKIERDKIVFLRDAG